MKRKIRGKYLYHSIVVQHFKYLKAQYRIRNDIFVSAKPKAKTFCPNNSSAEGNVEFTLP